MEDNCFAVMMRETNIIWEDIREGLDQSPVVVKLGGKEFRKKFSSKYLYSLVFYMILVIIFSVVTEEFLDPEINYNHVFLILHKGKSIERVSDEDVHTFSVPQKLDDSKEIKGYFVSAVFYSAN